MSKSNILRAEWTCDRCGNLGESTQVLIADSVGTLIDVEVGEAVRDTPMPGGWGALSLNYDGGASLRQDLCRTCINDIEGVCSRRLNVVEPETDGEVKADEDKPTRRPVKKRPPTKKVAKKTSARPPKVCMIPDCGCDGTPHDM